MTATTADVSIAQVRVPERGWSSNFRAVKVVWRREIIRFKTDRARIAVSLIQPILYLFVLGTGLSNLAGANAGGVNFRTFIFPGVMSLAVMFTAIFSAGSIVWDREFGFLREMLVAPVSRASIVIGKCLGGATVAAFQGTVMLCLAGLVGVPYNPILIVTLMGEMLLLAFVLTALGVLLASRMKNMQSFMATSQMFLMPMFFLSGALYPLHNLPGWLTVLTRLDPVTYAVDPMRKAVFGRVDIPPAVLHTLHPGVTWNGWHVPTGLEVLIVALMGATFLVVSILEFSKAE